MDNDYEKEIVTNYEKEYQKVDQYKKIMIKIIE